MIKSVPHIVAASVCSIALVSSSAAAEPDCSKQGTPLTFRPLVARDLELIYTPPGGSPDEGHARWIKAIRAAERTIDMEMFHLDDPKVVDALCAAAHDGRQVRLIVDNDWYKGSSFKGPLAKLHDCHVDVRHSSPAFSITHEKAMVLDRKLAFVTAMNMTMEEEKTRDFGVITTAPSVVAEVLSIFESDWKNYEFTAHGGAEFPPTNVDDQDSLVWSPVNSERKLVELIRSAKPGKTLYCSTESLTDPAIEDALVDASKCGVKVAFIAPQCDENPNPKLNLKPESEMNRKAGKTIAYAMPGAGSPEVPYMHSKMCLANYDEDTGAGTAFVGSVNSSTDSTHKARELGVVFESHDANRIIHRLFSEDLKKAIDPAAPANCR